MLVRLRDELLATGLTDRQLRQSIDSGIFKRLHRGTYILMSDWNELWPEGKQLVTLLAVRRASPGAGPVFSHRSAAVLWGLPLYGDGRDPHVHVLIEGRRHSRTVAGVARHDLAISEHDIVERHGLRCTSLARTVFDLARTEHAEVAVCAADAALASVAVDRHVQDADAAARWRDDMMRLAVGGLRGVRQARWVTEFADGRAQLPGESVSRLQLYRLGFSDVALQVPVVGGDDDRYFMDFGFERSRAFGEYDGEGKYLEADLRATETPADAVLAEKRREDDVRGATGWRVVRWGKAHIATADTLGARLRAFGIRPPG